VPEIFGVTPGRGRAGDPAVAIAGSAFAPATPFGNAVEFDGVFTTIVSQDEFDISALPPAGLAAVDKWIMIAVQRRDTFDWATFRWWSKALLATLQADSRLSEKIPSGEDLDNPTNEMLTAATWNRLVTFVEFLTQEVLTAKGSILSRDAIGLAELPVGTDGTEVFRTPAGSGHPVGLLWGKPKRIWTYRWGRLIDSANMRNGAMRANGTADDVVTGVKPGTHGMARAGVIRHITVKVETASGPGTLDQIQVVYNLSTVIHDSGTGLGLTADSAYQADLNTWRAANDLEVRAFKVGGGTMELTATLTVEEELRPDDGSAAGTEDLISDAVAVTDSIAAELVLGIDPIFDAISVTDSLQVELEAHVQLADAALVTDALTTETIYSRDLADQIDAQDAIEVEIL